MKKWLVAAGVIQLVVFWGYFLTTSNLTPSSPVCHKCRKDTDANGKVYPVHLSQEKIRIAIATPLVPSQMRTLLRCWDFWEENLPCNIENPITTEMSVTYIINFRYESNPHGDTDYSLMEEVLRKHFSLLKSSKCFHPQSPVFIHSEKPTQKNKPEEENDETSQNSCLSLADLMETLSNDHDYMLYYEPDLLPIRSLWAEKLKNLIYRSMSSDPFWQMGSLPFCPSSYNSIADNSDFHLNSNSIFSLKDPEFFEYLERVQTQFPHCTDGQKSVDFDILLYKFRQLPENYEYVRTIIGKFQVSKFILNKCKHAYDVKDILEENPKTFFVHSEYPQYPYEMQSLFKAIEMVGIGDIEDLEKELREKYHTMLWTGEMTAKDVAIDLCTKATLTDLPNCKIIFEGVDLSPKRDQEWFGRFPNKLYIWCTDLHSGPIASNMGLFRELGAAVHAEVDFGNCIHFNLCRDRLKEFINIDWKGFSLQPCPYSLRRKFFEAYRHDEEFSRVDVVICSHPVANCELYMPFDKVMIVYATTRLEFGRNDDSIDWRQPLMDEDADRNWEEWIANVKAIANQPYGIIAANNLYDVNYIKYFTGIDAEYLPSWCGDADSTYAPSRKQILIGLYRDNLDFPEFRDKESWEHPILSGLTDAMKARERRKMQKHEFIRLRTAYQNFYTFQDIASHPALVVIPYQGSTMSMCEFYRLNIPTFYPSKTLLFKWYMDHGIMWERIYGHPKCFGQPCNSTIDPNNDTPESFRHWMETFDFYVWPHLLYFDSWEHLLEQLDKIDLMEVSQKMNQYNIELKKTLKTKWNNLLWSAQKKRDLKSYHFLSFDEAILQRYNDSKLLVKPQRQCYKTK